MNNYIYTCTYIYIICTYIYIYTYVCVLPHLPGEGC